MSIRHIAAAALLVCAGVAHADPIANTSATGGFLNNWTTGAGTDVLGSGVLGSGNLNLVGGVSHSSANNSGMTEALLSQSSSNMVNGSTQLFVSQGIEGSYLLASGNGILVASLGSGTSVIASAGGGLIVDGNAGTPSAGGGGLQVGGSAGGSAGGAPATGGTSSGSIGGGAQTGAPTDTSSGAGGTGSNASDPLIPKDGDTPAGSGNGVGGGNLQLPAAIDAAAVPEPSSIALMLAGMVGAGALSRRRNRG